MIRFAMLLCLVLSILAVCAQAADNPPYALTAQATQSGKTIAVSVKLVFKEKADVPNAGRQDVTTTLASPKVTLFEGQVAQLAISNPAATATGSRPQGKPDDMESGFDVEVISIKGKGEILIVTKVIEHREIVWADATTVHIDAAATSDAAK